MCFDHCEGHDERPVSGVPGNRDEDEDRLDSDCTEECPEDCWADHKGEM